MYVTISEMSKLAGVTRTTMYNNWQELKKLGYTKEVNNKCLIDTKSIEYLNRNKTKSYETIKGEEVADNNSNLNEMILRNYIDTQKDLLNKLESLQEQLDLERSHTKELELKLIQIVDSISNNEVRLLEEPKPKKESLFRRLFKF